MNHFKNIFRQRPMRRGRAGDKSAPNTTWRITGSARSVWFAGHTPGEVWPSCQRHTVLFFARRTMTEQFNGITRQKKNRYTK